MEEVASEMIMVSHDMAYGGDLDGVAKVMEDMVNQIDVRTLNVTKPRAKDIVKKVNQVSIGKKTKLHRKVPKLQTHLHNPLHRAEAFQDDICKSKQSKVALYFHFWNLSWDVLRLPWQPPSSA